jgi:peptidoglycan/LPS O-acetylase OafA/YrhL
MQRISEKADAANGASRSAAQIPALDGIRGLAIVWVVLHNASDLPTAPSGGISHLFVWLTHPGWIGVQLFFALSGFLITAGLLETQAAQNYFRSFYARRALRILPLYYGVLLLVLVVLPHLATLPPPFTTAGQAPLWLFTANMAGDVPYGFGHFWSLSVEEQFYLFWPLVVFRLPAWRLFIVCLWIAAGALLLRCALVAYGTSWWTLYTFTPCRMDALALGGAGACALRVPAVSEWLRSHVRSLAAGALALFLLGIPLTRGYERGALSLETLGYTVLAVCSAAAVTLTALVRGRHALSPESVLRSRALRSCGRYSYAMYVFHGLLHKLIGEHWLNRHYGPEPSVAVVCCYCLAVLAVSFVLGLASYQLYERRFLRMKQWFVPRSMQHAR